MSGPASNISAIKLGLLVAWPAFWMGVPLKLVISLLLLAMGMHPWEMPGLAFLLLLSIPIDIWALNLSTKTVFLERLRLKAPDSAGLTIWWQAMLLNAIYLPILYFVGGGAVSMSKSIAAWILEFFKEIPVAERISIELVLWGTPATIALLLLVLGWLYFFGKIVKRQAALAVPGDAAFSSVVRQWDLMRVPADQPLMLTAITAVGMFLVILLWAFMPVTTPHPHESEKKDVAKTPVFKPTDALQKTEKVIAKAEATVQSLEEKAASESPKDEKSKGKAGGKESPKAGTESAKPMKAAVTPEKEHSHGAEDHKH
ncbi:MAG: hypothetical protein H0W13_09940 [Nitrospirales bacterium]|nr:hypothetical protein [Nitrospirales bacterium]